VRNKIIPALIFFCSLNVAAKTKTPERVFRDGIVAEVDGAAILHSQVDEKVKEGPLITVSSFPADESAPVYERALQDLINSRLIKRKAAEKGIEVEESKVDEHIDRIIAENHLTKTRFKQLLREQGKSYEEYRQDIKDQMLLMHFRGRELMPLVKVTQRDVENYYFKKSGTSAEVTNLQLRQIFLPASKGSSDYQNKLLKAQEIHNQLLKGKSFKELEKEHLKAEGSTFTVKVRDLAPQIRTVVAALGEGEFSPPVATDSGIYVFMVEKKTFADSGGFAAQKEKLEYELRQEELNEQLKRWLKDERLKANITLKNK
jgi:peptidyl-prolyl cis-trans isomerase SurA